MALGAPSPVEHPGRNLQEAVCLRTVKSAAEKHAIGLLDDGVDPHLVRKPGMMRVQNLTPDGLETTALDDRIFEPYGVRAAGWINLSGCLRNRVQLNEVFVNLTIFIECQERTVCPSDLDRLYVVQID